MRDSHDQTTGIPEAESIAYLGLCYADLVERLGEAEAKERYARWKRHAFMPLGPLRRALDKWRPRAVLTTNSPKSERAALVVAKERGLATMALEDTLGMRQRIFPDFVPTFRADRIGVCTSIATKYLGEQGADPASVRLTGSPAFDHLAHAADREGVRTALGLGPRDRAYVFSGQAYTDLGAALAHLERALGGVRGGRLLVRRHPTRRTPESAATLSRHPAVIVAEDVPIPGLLAAADVLVTVSSTTAIEAILVARPVVQLGGGLGITDAANEDASDLPLYAHGAALLAGTAAELEAHVASLADMPWARALTERASALFVKPGHATAAVADEIRELTGIAA